MKKILFIVIVFICFGCSEKKQQKVKFSEKQIEQLGLNKAKKLNICDSNRIMLDLKDFFQSEVKFSIGNLIYDIKYVPLQTTEESIIAEVNKLIYAENHFFGSITFGVGKIYSQGSYAGRHIL